MNTQYVTQVEKFMDAVNAKMEVKLLGSMLYFDDDKEPRDVYQITLTRKGKSYSFRFGQSVLHSRDYVEKSAQQRNSRGEPWGAILRYKRDAVKVPTAYDVLAAVQKYEVGTFEDFCSEFGYDTDSRKAEKTYFEIQKEYAEIEKLFSDVMEELQEIQ
jgi:hypothetical protein